MAAAVQSIADLRRVFGVCRVRDQYAGNRAWQNGRIGDFIFRFVCDQYSDHHFGRGDLLQGKNILEEYNRYRTLRRRACHYQFSVRKTRTKVRVFI